MAERGECSSDLASVQLTEADVPGAALSDPLESYTVPELRWWLLCRGIKHLGRGKSLSLSPGEVKRGRKGQNVCFVRNMNYYLQNTAIQI